MVFGVNDFGRKYVLAGFSVFGQVSGGNDTIEQTGQGTLVNIQQPG
jgi:hypothetical protein